ncbi:MAG: hypothetical protein AAFW89_01980 [Bacteroidota bacterium]
MKADKLLLELELLLEQSGYTLRKERGAFRGSDCVIKGDKLVIINKNKPAESQLGTIARVLSDINFEDIYIKPVVRKELSSLWSRLSIEAQLPAEKLELE